MKRVSRTLERVNGSKVKANLLRRAIFPLRSRRDDPAGHRDRSEY
jgi:hypothetical protein